MKLKDCEWFLRSESDRKYLLIAALEVSVPEHALACKDKA